MGLAPHKNNNIKNIELVYVIQLYVECVLEIQKKKHTAHNGPFTLGTYVAATYVSKIIFNKFSTFK